MRLSEAQRREPRALRGVRPGLLALALLATACQGARPPEALPERLPAPRLRGALPAASASVPLTGRPTPVVGSTVEEELSVSFHAGGMAPIRLSLEAAGAFAKVEGGGARIELSRLELQPESGALREDVLARLDSLDPPRGAQVGPLALLERAVAARGVAAALSEDALDGFALEGRWRCDRSNGIAPPRRGLDCTLEGGLIRQISVPQGGRLAEPARLLGRLRALRTATQDGVIASEEVHLLLAGGSPGPEPLRMDMDYHRLWCGTPDRCPAK